MSISERKFIVCAFALITIVAACVKNKTTPVLVSTGSSIGQIIKLGTNLTIFDSAMSRSGVFLTLDSLNPVSGSAPFTVFAPTDMAFKNAGIYDSTIHNYDPAYLKRLMLYHIYSGYQNTISNWSTLITSRNFPIESASGDYFFLTLDSTGFYVNGYQVIQPDVIAKNGVVNALSGVLIPPVGDIDSTLNSIIKTDTTLSYFVQALYRTQGRPIDLVALLSNKDSLFTVFAPTNAAFRLTADSTATAINMANPDSLAILLQTHIISGRVFSSDFPLDSVRFSVAAPTVALPKGDSLYFTSILGSTIRSVGDSTSASFIQLNILATNGVIHKINQVLFPFQPF